MDHRIAPARPLGRALTAALAAIAVAGAAAVFVAPAAHAQTKPAAEKKPPAKPAAPAGTPEQAPQTAAAPEPPPLMYTPWTKVCGKAQETDSKKICNTVKDGRLEDGRPMVVVQLIEPEGSEKKVLRVMVPPGLALQPGTRTIIDQEEPVRAPYVICFPAMCVSDYEITAATVAKLKKGKNLTVQAINMNNVAISLPVPLGDFAKAYDGPPTDPKVLEEQQRKMQDELQKKADEARKKLEAQQPPAAKK